MNNGEPSYGQLWTTTGDARALVVLGNNVSESGTIWCADDATGERVDPLVREMRFLEDRPLEATVSKCAGWARAGDSDAAWWCAWYWEGKNHPRSVWYYIAALRLDPRKHGWAFNRIIGDAHSPGLCRGVPEPDLDFLREVDEFNQAGQVEFVRDIRWGDWRDAVARAEAAVHLEKSDVTAEMAS